MNKFFDYGFFSVVDLLLLFRKQSFLKSIWTITPAVTTRLSPFSIVELFISSASLLCTKQNSPLARLTLLETTRFFLMFHHLINKPCIYKKSKIRQLTQKQDRQTHILTHKKIIKKYFILTQRDRNCLIQYTLSYVLKLINQEYLIEDVFT